MTQENIKFREIADNISTELLSPQWMVGMPLATEVELMERFQVSRITVRNALQRLVDGGIISRERGKRSVLIQKPADKKKIRRGLNFALLGNSTIVNSEESDLPSISISIIRELKKWGATLSLFPFLSDETPAGLPVVEDLLARNLVDGFFLSMMPDLIEIEKFLKEKNIPFVCLLQSEYNDEKVVRQIKKSPSVIVDELTSIHEYVDSAAKNGINQFVLLGSQEDFALMRTHDMFQKITGELGIKYTSMRMENPSFEELLALICRYRDPAGCLIISNKLLPLADAVLSFLKYRIPEDLSVVLFKHYTPDWTKWQGKYPIITRPLDKFGIVAAEKMRGLIDNNPEINRGVTELKGCIL